MTLDPGAAWDAATGSPVFGVLLTLAAYQAGRTAWHRTGRHPLVNPVLVAVLLVGVVLWATRVDYAEYLEGGRLVALLLGPATVALAWPLHQELPLVRRAAVPVLGAVVVGSGIAVASAVVVTGLLGGGELLALTMAPKSATTPVSIALAEDNGGLPALSAVLTIVAGILGAVTGPWFLSRLRVEDARVRGLAVGLASHGIGTAQMLHESRTAGAFAGLSMGLTALATSIWVPLLVPVLVPLVT
ncbi:LrgB family protein [Nocardioides caldifontis]|uniref:LrgB family protein n=1 Tax=Nocardioides caldifontis TaxID=2588938 RepID=UPI001EEFD3CF|nr:LrgB family protein [Nocardioides caldifontis]